MAVNLQHQTLSEFVSKFREEFKSADKEKAAKMAHWLYERYQAGDITWTQIQTAFNLDTQAKRDAFQAKLLSLRDAWQVVNTAQGE